jgi:hypothetical protein
MSGIYKKEIVMSDETTHMKAAREMRKIEQRIKHLTRVFVIQLNSKYQKHVSDEFLVSILSRGVLNTLYSVHQQPITQIAYDVAAGVFESTLEIDCRAGGNGHHVAQDYSKLFNDFEDAKNND